MDRFHYCFDNSAIDAQFAGECALVSAAICFGRRNFKIPDNLDHVSRIFIDSADSGAWRQNLDRDGPRYARNHAGETQFLNNYKTKIDALLNLPDRRVPIHRLKETAIPLCTKQISLESYF